MVRFLDYAELSFLHWNLNLCENYFQFQKIAKFMLILWESKTCF